MSMAQSDVSYSGKPLQLWRTVMNWLSFLLQIFVQIFVYSFAHGGALLSSPSSNGFRPLPVIEIPLQEKQQGHKKDGVAVSAAAKVDGGRVVAEEGGERAGRSDKLIVVLDLDETLVCAYETSTLPAVILSQATEAKLNWFELECVSADKECEGKSKINYVTVFERPGLHEFLKQLSEFADLVLFTAGLEGYARPLVDRIDSENRFVHRLYRPSTISTVVIVDNNPFSFLLQPLNGIPCVPFSAGQPHDDQLLEVLLPLLKELSKEKDVRPMLYEKFHMIEWFQNHGIPASLWPL
ncbi:CTD small phosphatase-like protein [Drosera capensis]